VSDIKGQVCRGSKKL